MSGLKSFFIVIVGVAVFLGGVVLFTSASGSQSSSDRPPVILVMTEATRADHMGPCYGYRRNTTPELCELAADGVLFEQAYAQGSFTALSVPPLLTSLPASVSGLRRFDAELPDEVVTFPETLAGTGYELVTNEQQVIQGRRSFTIFANYVQGFEVLYEPFSWLFSGDSPVFVWEFIRDRAHTPYAPPEEYRRWDTVEMDVEELQDTSNWELIQEFPRRWGWTLSGYDEHDMIDLYDGEIYAADAEIGRMMDRLKKAGMYNESLIIYTSDHGELFGGREEPRVIADHGGPPYEEVIHVPLIIKLPGNRYAGTRIEQPVRHVDIAPTVFDYLDVENRSMVLGRSLSPAIEEGEDLDIPVYASGASYRYFGRGIPGYEHWSLRLGDYKYLLKNATNPCDPAVSAEYRVYDLGAEGNRRVIDRSEQIAERYRTTLCELFSGWQEVGRIQGEKQLDEAIQDQLRDLGYME